MDGVLFQITKEVIALVTKIFAEGFKFYRDFAKNSKERNKLVKCETYYEMDSIKKLWRYVLWAIIEYISLDTRFDRVRTHHFVLLNHFYHGVKISFPFYLFTSMCKGISRHKKKPFVNPTLHEGLLLLIYEHFKA